VSTIICLDVETTGLNPALDYSLELGMVAVETPRFEIVDRFSFVIKPTTAGALKRLREMPERVVEMHTASGLLEDLKTAKRTIQEVAGVYGAVSAFFFLRQQQIASSEKRPAPVKIRLSAIVPYR
jgi:oligoribonuclease (3'-5' exoribonuclease)